MGEIAAKVINVPRRWCEWLMELCDLVEWFAKYRFLRWVFTKRMIIPARRYPDNVCLWSACRKEAFEKGPAGGWYCPKHLRENKLEHAEGRVEHMEETLVTLMLTVPHDVRIEERGNIVSAIEQICLLRKFRNELEVANDVEYDAEEAERRAVEDRT